MDLSMHTVPKAVPLLADTQERHPRTFPNMVECLRRDPNLPDPCLLSSRLLNSLVSKDMVDHLPNLLVNILISRWDMEVLPALVAMAVVLSKPPISGVRPLVKPLEMDLVDTKVKHRTRLTTR